MQDRAITPKRINATMRRRVESSSVSQPKQNLRNGDDINHLPDSEVSHGSLVQPGPACAYLA